MLSLISTKICWFDDDARPACVHAFASRLIATNGKATNYRKKESQRAAGYALQRRV